MVWRRLRSPWVAGLLGLLVIVYGIVGFSYWRATGEQSDLQGRLARLQTVARSASAQRIAQVTAEFEQIQQAMPPAELDELNIIPALLELGGRYGVAIAGLPKYEGETKKQVGEKQYRVLRFSLTASGNDDDLWSFVQELDAGKQAWQTLVLEDLTLTFAETTTTTALKFSIYTKVEKAQ